MQTEKSSPDLLLQALAAGDMAVLDQIYDTYRDDFLRWAKSKFPTVGRDDLLDAWHDTMIMFYEQVRDRKLTHLTCELKSYLFLIGNRRLIKMHKKAEKTDLVDEIDANIQIEESINALEWEEMDDVRRTLLTQAVDELPGLVGLVGRLTGQLKIMAGLQQQRVEQLALGDIFEHHPQQRGVGGIFGHVHGQAKPHRAAHNPAYLQLATLRLATAVQLLTALAVNLPVARCHKAGQRPIDQLLARHPQ